MFSLFQAFLKAWDAACASSGKVKIHIPPGTYKLGPVKFKGPCKNVTTLTIVHKGTIKASTNIDKYKSDYWVEFYRVNGLTLEGGGTFDGQGADTWMHNSCSKKKHCQALPVSVKFIHTIDTTVKRFKSINPKFFHMAVIGCEKFHATNLTLEAPEESPNTDGIHIETSTNLKITDANIRTGDD
ncbi:exopolygalacturonase-like protein [Carex littledalei]|uniref:Exopolygalacturonase-like protein n=1 Tax=Carex littledalei TaxID=544730 RepID=A0A833QGJ2_9POAL|nr:exopolygalacturonase-like protein [Carex littledalei]